jgi:xeroderma pigmentosum group C-complementing protein
MFPRFHDDFMNRRSRFGHALEAISLLKSDQDPVSACPVYPYIGNMPPHVPRKRVRTPSPVEGDRVSKSSSKGKAKAKASATVVPPPRKSTLFDDLETGAKNRSAEKTKSALQQMHDDDSSSLTSLSDSDVEFEDVPVAKRQKIAGGSEDEEDDDDDDDIEFEDVPNQEPRPDPVPSGDLELTLYQDNRVPLLMNLAKKGASKREKQIRNVTHCMHVQFLLWHNAVRNSWLCDEEVQAIMISHLPPRLWEEVDRWRQSSGLEVKDEPSLKSRKGAKDKTSTKSNKGKGKKPARDWSDAADRLEKGVPDMSHGDPLFRLMKVLCGWWKQRFQITGPGLRKLGYMDVRRLAKWRESFQSEEHDPEKHGEKILDLNHFREHAQKCEGSRDVGAQVSVIISFPASISGAHSSFW